MKNEKGMGHITLIICIAAIIAIIVIAINVVVNKTKEQNMENLTTDMLLLQGKIKVIEQANEMNEENQLKGKKVSENKEDEKVKKLLESNIISEEEEIFDSYFIIDSNDLNEMNLEDSLQGEYYIINYNNYEIIYTKGFKDKENDKILYKLSELLAKKEENNTINEEDTTTVNEEITAE